MSGMSSLLPVGGILPAGTIPKYLGTMQQFEDVDYTQAVGPRNKLTNHIIHTIVVKNSSGGALSKSTIVKWADAGVGTEAGAVTGANEIGVGVVDPYLTRTVAVGEMFNLFVCGPIPVMSGAGVAVNAIVAPGATGEYVAAANNSAGAYAVFGRTMAASSAADQVRRVLCKFNP